MRASKMGTANDCKCEVKSHLVENSKNYTNTDTGNQQDTTAFQMATVEEEDPRALAYLEHLLKDGCEEGDSGNDMEMPEWYDEQLFRKGQHYMSIYRFVIQSGMLAGLVAVLAIPSILEVLICTRQSSTCATAYRRYIRTILHTNAWYENSPTDKKSKFWTSLEAVRKAHSRSSRACVKLGAGKITQKDLAVTQFGFMGFLSLGAHRIQLYDDEFLTATSHMWRVLGYLLGIKDEYNICASTWPETKLRLDIVMRKVFEPALENTTKEFDQMCKALLDGLWYINTTLTVGSYLFLTKRLCYVKGYEYYDFDYRPGTKPDPQQHRCYKDLGWWDRIVVCYALFLVTYLHKYNIVRWYLNFRVWLTERLVDYFPYLAILKFGSRWAYVRIFNARGDSNDFEYHWKEE